VHIVLPLSSIEPECMAELCSVPCALRNSSRAIDKSGLRTFRSRRIFCSVDDSGTITCIDMRPLLPFLAAALSLVSAWDIGNPSDRHACQSYSGNPLEGCDQERTVFVDVGGDSKFKTVQSGRVKIFLPQNCRANSK
jgi:hypothetical protein